MLPTRSVSLLIFAGFLWANITHLDEFERILDGASFVKAGLTPTGKL